MSDYQRWIDEVYELVRKQLDGEGGQSGGQRYYGEGIFTHGMEYGDRGRKGDVQFQVTRRELLIRQTKRLPPLEWRAYQPNVVAEMLLKVYSVLEEC